MDDVPKSNAPSGDALQDRRNDIDPDLILTAHGQLMLHVVHPVATHAVTIILLHGRGSNGPKFGTNFITSNTSTGSTLFKRFPSAKWIFPTAKKRRAVLFNRLPIHQWFDIYDINNQSYKEHLQVDGLQETTEMLHGLIEEEIGNGIPAERIIIGGLSQGCAASLYALLCYRQRLGGYIGMSGWLPFAKYVEAILEPSTEDGNEGDDIFGASDDEQSASSEDNEEMDDAKQGKARDPIVEAIGFLKDNISFPRLLEDKLPALQTPVFLGHGLLDEKVRVGLGEQARDALDGLGFDVTWKCYTDLGHWYKVPDEMDHIENFLKGILEA
ncbi:hypothetical protein TWF730_010457 [Orbilia blumenaviensis]|uniref:Phospholipase/carboxylesterase/thioesterase domain-containing protein n=1 Tax=Orbilia blumenaviensis TaxID=1796055 RepID=A0AAV9UNQ4_9PEZI